MEGVSGRQGRGPVAGLSPGPSGRWPLALGRMGRWFWVRPGGSEALTDWSLEEFPLSPHAPTSLAPALAVALVSPPCTQHLRLCNRTFQVLPPGRGELLPSSSPHLPPPRLDSPIGWFGPVECVALSTEVLCDP